MKHKITVYPDQVLVSETREIPKDQIQADTFSTIGSAMLEIMREKHGVGLAANQVGLPLNMCVIEVQQGSPYIMLNPRVTKKYGDPKEQKEGCLSLPGVVGPVKRWDKIDAEYEDVRGETIALTATGLLSQAIQHETDHLQGFTILNRMTEYHRTKAKKTLDKWKRVNKK